MDFHDYNRDGWATEFLMPVGGVGCAAHYIIILGVSRRRPQLHAWRTSIELHDLARRPIGANSSPVRPAQIHPRASTDSSTVMPASRMSARKRPVLSSAWSGTVRGSRALSRWRNLMWLPRWRTTS